jgi:hypothetical protein
MPFALYDLILHLTTIGIVWLAVFLSIKVFRRYALKIHYDNVQLKNILRLDNEPIDDGEKSRNTIVYVAKFFNQAASCIAILCVLVTFLFLYRPTERKVEEIGKMNVSTVGKSPKELFPEHDIDKTNKEILETRGKEMNIRAEQANDKAIEDAFKLFESKEIEK